MKRELIFHLSFITFYLCLQRYRGHFIFPEKSNFFFVNIPQTNEHQIYELFQK